MTPERQEQIKQQIANSLWDLGKQVGALYDRAAKAELGDMFRENGFTIYRIRKPVNFPRLAVRRGERSFTVYRIEDADDIGNPARTPAPLATVVVVKSVGRPPRYVLYLGGLKCNTLTSMDAALAIVDRGIQT